MKWKSSGWISTFVAVLFVCLSSPVAYASDPYAVPMTPNTSNAPPKQVTTRPFSHIALGFSGGSMGPGFEVVTTLSQRTNLRLDGHFFRFSIDSKQDGVDYNGKLHLGDVRLSYDFYPFHGKFRVSGGMAVFNQLSAQAVTVVPAGRTINFNDVDYYSSATDPLHGAGRITLPRKVAPTLSFGWGNAIPRSKKHLAFPVEIGVAFAGTPQFDLTMEGSACSTPDPEMCGPVSADTSFKTNLDAERRKINRHIEPLRFYPIVNFGVTYKF